jgi:hypothetical protein
MQIRYKLIKFIYRMFIFNELNLSYGRQKNENTIV